MAVLDSICKHSVESRGWVSGGTPFLLLCAVFLWCLQGGAAFAAPLIDYTAPALVNELGGKESHIYPWGTGADQRRATRSGMGYIVFTGNGQKLTTVSAVFGFTSKETGTPNIGDEKNFVWYLRIEPITSADAATWYVEQFWNTSTGAYAASTKPGALDLNFNPYDNPGSVTAAAVGAFIGVNLKKVTVDASSANYVLQSGQLYRLVLIPWTKEPIPAGCTSANPACVTFLVALPGLSWAKDGGINNTGGQVDSCYQTLHEYRSYGTSKYNTGTTQWYGGKLIASPSCPASANGLCLQGPTGAYSALGMEQTNWAYAVEVPCVDSEGLTDSKNSSAAGTVTTSEGSFKDYCVMRNNLIEQYCDAAGVRQQQVITCPNGCTAGKCNP